MVNRPQVLARREEGRLQRERAQLGPMDLTLSRTVPRDDQSREEEVHVELGADDASMPTDQGSRRSASERLGPSVSATPSTSPAPSPALTPEPEQLTPAVTPVTPAITPSTSPGRVSPDPSVYEVSDEEMCELPFDPAKYHVEPDYKLGESMQWIDPTTPFQAPYSEMGESQATGGAPVELGQHPDIPPEAPLEPPAPDPENPTRRFVLKTQEDESAIVIPRSGADPWSGAYSDVFQRTDEGYDYTVRTDLRSMIPRSTNCEVIQYGDGVVIDDYVSRHKVVFITDSQMCKLNTLIAEPNMGKYLSSVSTPLRSRKPYNIWHLQRTSRMSS